ncbi:MAG: hypothetical protein MUC50_20180 [Myxococcota bacterium]|nr:hypothetical protein [Myxococcota bacterium]
MAGDASQQALFSIGSFSASIGFHGFVGVSLHAALNDPTLYDFRNANVVGLGVKARPAEHVLAVAEVELHNVNMDDNASLEMLGSRDLAAPVRLRVGEAYLDIDDFLPMTSAVALSLRAGNQYVAWGEADGINPTNPFDPYNLENPIDYDAKLPTLALKAALAFGADVVRLEGVLAPRFAPSVFPLSLLLGPAGADSPLVPSLDTSELEALLGEPVELRLALPEPEDVSVLSVPFDWKNAGVGARIRWSLFGFDWSISYARARETVPVAWLARGQALLSPPGSAGCPASGPLCVDLGLSEVGLYHPRVHIIGANLRGGIGDLGLWAEAALIFPEGMATSVDVQLGGFPSSTTGVEVIDDQPFVKWVLGTEYTFPGGVFINAQWVHGFITEVSGDALHDYLFPAIGFDAFSEKLHLELDLGGELNLNGPNPVWGGLVHAFLTYRPFDATALTVGALLALGESGTTFRLFEQLDQVYLRARVDF